MYCPECGTETERAYSGTNPCYNCYSCKVHWNYTDGNYFSYQYSCDNSDICGYEDIQTQLSEDAHGIRTRGVS